MTSYSDSVRLLYSLEKYGMKFGLEGISRLLRQLGDPHLQFPTIHIAGTNGKGSTASMLAAMFTAAGYRTGLYTSPHLIDFTERIRIDGKPIPQSAIARLTGQLRGAIRKQHATFFEATTAIAFAWFAQRHVDLAVIETGLGGRLDSTNVITPLVSVITNVGLEHTEILGSTIEKIAAEKAGIIKKGVPCVSGVENRRALSVLKRVCRSKNAPLVSAAKFSASIRRESLRGTLVDLSVSGQRYDGLRLSLPGRFQVRNAALALAAMREVLATGRFVVPERSVRAGLASVQEMTNLQGRFSLVGSMPPVVLDVAHNPHAVATLVSSLKALKVEGVFLVFGVMRDKDHVAMAQLLEPLVQEVVAVSAKNERSRSASDVAASFTRVGIRVRAALSVEEGVRLALQRRMKKQCVLVTGSHYVVGEALEYLLAKKALTIKA